MFFDFAAEFEQVLGMVKHAERVSFREVEACLRAARPVLVKAGVSQQDIDVAAATIIDVLLDGTVLADGGEAVAKQVDRVLRNLPKVRAVQSSRLWSVGAPVREGLFSFAPGQQLRRPAKGALHMYTCDHHHPALDPAAIRRMMRSLGRDFGPDSSSGGSLARV